MCSFKLLKVKERLFIEKWKQIDNFSNYEVSNKGNVRNKKTGKILSQRYDRDGYCHIGLVDDNGIKRDLRVHRLVAQAFVPNPYPNRNQVNHINEIKDDNSADNLSWCTVEENNNHGSRNEKAKISRKNNSITKGFGIIRLCSKTGKFIAYYSNKKEAVDAVVSEGVSRKQALKKIAQCCRSTNGANSKFHNSIWQYVIKDGLEFSNKINDIEELF